VVSTGDWPVVARHRLPPSPSSASLARTLVGSALNGCPPEVVDVAQLLVSELVTNTVLHTRSGPELTIVTGDERITVSVDDASPVPPHVCDTDPDGDGGRGLQLVSALAQDWGWENLNEGKRIWFTL